jgi:hypothetical protein
MEKTKKYSGITEDFFMNILRIEIAHAIKIKRIKNMKSHFH